jgi:hypothetical protein
VSGRTEGRTLVTRCPRCGTARRVGEGVCPRCETPFDEALPPGTPAAPSLVQTHGTVMAAVLVGFVLLLGYFALRVRDVGPFTANLVTSQRSESTLTAEVLVRNTGERAGRANCGLVLVDAGGARLRDHRFVTAPVPADGELTERVVVAVDPGVRATEVTC